MTNEYPFGRLLDPGRAVLCQFCPESNRQLSVIVVYRKGPAYDYFCSACADKPGADGFTPWQRARGEHIRVCVGDSIDILALRAAMNTLRSQRKVVAAAAATALPINEEDLKPHPAKERKKIISELARDSVDAVVEGIRKIVEDEWRP